jgi:antitoxin component YwqK of YwqJK toxin-antitoxin module/Tfp pilus assembly protein PilF
MDKLRKQKVVSPKPFLFTATLFASIFANGQSNFSEIYNSDEFIKKGVEFFDNEKYTDAIIQFEKVSRADIEYLHAQYEKAYTLYNLKKYEELETMLKKHIKSGDINQFPGMYIIYGNLLSVQERFEESEKMYQEGKKIIPKSNGLLFNMAIMYIRNEQRQKAVDVLKELQEVNPNNAMSHYLLGLLAFEDGQVVPASLALLGYLMIDPLGNNAQDAVIKLNTKFGGVAKENPTLKFSEKGDDFSELELILKNELALSTKYKLKSSIDDNFPRQLQAIMEYLPTHTSKGGFFDTYYVPWLTEISKRNYTEHFTYYSLASYETQLGKSLTSQKKKIESFAKEFIANSFWELYAKRNRMHFGKNEDVVIYLQNGLPYSQGKIVNGKSEGKYLYMNDQGQPISELNFLNDALDGMQHYFYPNLEKSDDITYSKGKKQGPFKDYYWNGAIRLEGSYTNEQNDGNHKSYFPNGGVLCEFNYNKGVQNGKNTCYWPNGTKSSEHTFVNGKVEGVGISYNEAGDKIREFNFTNGSYNGKGMTYYDGKQLKSTIEYANDLESNDSKEFYPNNQLKKETIYKNGKISKFLYYDLNGDLIEESLYDDKGKRTEYRNYSKGGKLYLTEIYKNEEVQKILLHYPDPANPKEINLKNAQVEVKDSEGVVVGTGQYKDYKLEGEWTYYDEMGKIHYKKNYQQGKINGMVSFYTGNNILKYKENSLENQSHGLYESYLHDKVYLKIYSKENENHGPYQYFYPNGNLSSEGFFVDNERNYYQYVYSIDGKMMAKKTWVEDQLVHEIGYDQKGDVQFEFNYFQKNGKFDLKNSKNQTLYQLELKNGVKNGLTTTYQFDGTKTNEISYINDERHGPIAFYYPNGVKSSEGNYYVGKAQGVFNYYDQFGNIRLKTHFLFDEDHGESTQYFPNGKTSVTYSELLGKDHGEKKFYNFAGKAVVSIQFELDRPVSYRVLNAQGELGESQNITLGNAQIESKYPNGKTAFKINFVKGLREGTTEMYEESGQMITQANYKSGLLHGERIQYYENGKIFKKENFQMNEYHGLVEVFETTGNPYLTSEYYYDILHGKVMIYKNGKIEQTKIYDSGSLVEVL